MIQKWKLRSSIRSHVLLLGEGYELDLQDGEGEALVKFSFPKKVENIGWTNWQHMFPKAAWDYDVTIFFKAESETDAQNTAIQKIEDLVARLSFIGSVPVSINGYGSITNAPENAKAGEQYITIGLFPDHAFEDDLTPLIGIDDAGVLSNFLAPDIVDRVGFERVNRSLKWLQQSYFAQSPIDEFISLMLAFESVSHLLKKPKARYWKCNSCKNEMECCPNCGKSTEWGGSGNSSMKHFACKVNGWDPNDWKTIWDYRNTILHGSQDLTVNEQIAISKRLRALEMVVINALRVILNVPSGVHPLGRRKRIPFLASKLNIKWTAGDQGGPGERGG